jgi:hypothetical protein
VSSTLDTSAAGSGKPRFITGSHRSRWLIPNRSEGVEW